jgi:hypothetical protein
MRGAVLSGHVLVCWSCVGTTVPVTKMGTFFFFVHGVIRDKMYFKTYFVAAE